MILVLDTSVLIAASISRAGVCAELLEDVLTHHELVLSDFIVEEVSRKLRQKFEFPKKEVSELARFFKLTATFVAPAEIDPTACRDPQDVPVLGTAVAANADLLITVDKDLLTLGSFQGIGIVKPGEFWKRTTGWPSVK
ncbi:MAG: putative toxin-antitoxin system toxin component, PIN family [Pseudomonadota bacterium]|nr:putative toxin-antitoxin system toxin component, PIN family [Pseudomonadota bacterium]